MKIRYLGFLPVTILFTWGFYYAFFVKHGQSDPLALLSAGVIALAIITLVFAGIYWAVGMFE